MLMTLIPIVQWPHNDFDVGNMGIACKNYMYVRHVIIDVETHSNNIHV